MSTLYVLEPDTRLEKEYGRLLVTKEDEVLLRVPIQKVSAVVLVGVAGATTQALHSLLRQGIPLFMVRRSGELIGRLAPPTSFNLPLRQAQYRRNQEADFAFQLAREIVTAKIHNQAVLASRLSRRKRDISVGDLQQMKHAKQAASTCNRMDSLLGIEGSAANAYFNVLQKSIHSDWGFTGRVRRPPKDPINALLSLGYTFLGYAMIAALEVVGLDPFLGYFHQEAYGRPSLALDLIEEFRAPLVDSLVLTLINKGLLKPDDFQTQTKGGVKLTQKGMRLFVQEFEDRLETEITLAEIGRPLSYRKIMEVQSRKMANLILGKEQSYRPFRWR
ncbi:MAG: CRISPR-associated endonuclease Cas1 [Chloroflexota bacterium]